jgi:plasmid maintenance system antidote protein VapI
MKTKSLRFAKSEHQREKQTKKNELKEAKWLLERIRPGQLLLKYFIKPRRLTLDQVAKKLEMQTEDIVEMRKITPAFADRCERCFGWPAQVLLTWQLLYDVEEQWWGEETFATALKEHMQGQRIFLAQVKSRKEMLQKERPFVKIEHVSGVKHLKRLLAKLERAGTLEIFWVHDLSKKWSIFGKVRCSTPQAKRKNVEKVSNERDED